MDIKAAIHFNCRQGTAVQAKPMAVLAGRETVVEDADQVFRGDAFTAVLDAEA
ncbi:hypothetical protein D3C80_2006220 [compost metagenome]